VDVVDLGEVAHTVIRARHHPGQALNPSAKGWRDRSRPLHVNPPRAPNGGIRALKSPDAGSLAAALNPANKQQEQARRSQQSHRGSSNTGLH
jgi:hypothetical protein